MKIFNIIIFVFLLSNVNSQEFIKISYAYSDSYSLIKDNIKSELITGKNGSIFRIYDKIYDKNTLKLDIKTSSIVGDTIDYIHEIYKNFKQKKIYAESKMISQENKTQVDELNLFKWKRVSGEMNILGYNCSKAITEHRGREYEAYYTTEIKSNDGPWKFNGLPGAILYIKEKNNRIEYKATEIQEIDSYNLQTTLDLNSVKTWDELLLASRIIFWNSQPDLRMPNRFKTNSIEIYDVNVPPYIEVLYEVYSEFSYEENGKMETEETLRSDFILKTDYFSSNYDYQEKVINTQLKEYSIIRGLGTTYKNLIDEYSLSFGQVKGEKYIVSSNFKEQEWEILPEYDTILNIKVQKAVLKTDKHEIEAWFANSIKINNGPGSSYGLPGLILKLIVERGSVMQTDYSTAKKIEFKNEKFTPNIPKPKRNLKVISENQYDELLEQERSMYN